MDIEDISAIIVDVPTITFDILVITTGVLPNPFYIKNIYDLIFELNNNLQLLF